MLVEPRGELSDRWLEMLLPCQVQFLRIFVTLFLKHVPSFSLPSLKKSGTAGEEWSNILPRECLEGFLGYMEDLIASRITAA